MAGIDGCRGGWLAILGKFTPEKGCFTGEDIYLTKSIEEIFSFPALVFAIDMPLGLPLRFSPKGRLCDRLARQMLGPRRASIFTPPPREALSFNNYQKLRAKGIRISKQSFYLIPKIRALRAALKGPVKDKVFETHPELIFKTLAGETIPSKHTAEGLAKRLELLLSLGLFKSLKSNWEKIKACYRRDLIDAYACLLVAKRIFCGEAKVIPEDPPRDDEGLPLAIWY